MIIMSNSEEGEEFKGNPLLERFLQDFSSAEIPNVDYEAAAPIVEEPSKMLAITDPLIGETGSEIMQEGRISLAYEKLYNIPIQIAERFAEHAEMLDLSHNNITDLSFLSNFKRLHTLILDQNPTPDESTLPLLPNLEILWLNNCQILNISNWIHKINAQCANLKQLSLMGNPGASTVFNGATVLEQNDYTMFIISLLPNLEYLDDCPILEVQKRAAQANKSAYIKHGTPFRFRQRFGANQIYNLFRFDERHRRRSVPITSNDARN